jgi:hypothetical protein
MRMKNEENSENIVREKETTNTFEEERKEKQREKEERS